MTEADSIKAFFTENRRKLISINEVEKLAELPRGTLNYFLKGKRGLPQHHQDAIVRVISIVGYNPVSNEHRFI